MTPNAWPAARFVLSNITGDSHLDNISRPRILLLRRWNNAPKYGMLLLSLKPLICYFKMFDTLWHTQLFWGFVCSASPMGICLPAHTLMIPAPTVLLLFHFLRKRRQILKREGMCKVVFLSVRDTRKQNKQANSRLSIRVLMLSDCWKKKIPLEK